MTINGKSIIKSVYPKVFLFEQLGSSLPTGEHDFNKFWCHVFKAYKEFGEKIRLENSEELVAEPIFCNDSIRVGNRTVFQKSWIDNRVCYIKHILNENGTFMSFQVLKRNIELTQTTLHALDMYTLLKVIYVKLD